VAARSKIPLLSIVEATASHAASSGLKRLALLGTRFTMRADFYPEVFARRGMTIVRPPDEALERIHEIYMTELVQAIFRDTSRGELLDIARAMIRDEQVDGVILGGTELPLILSDASALTVPMLDTTRIHVATALQMLLE
jgi:aspartate racemase